MTELKGKIQGYSNSCRLQYTFSIMARITKQKINKEKVDIYNIINQLDLTDTYRTLYPMT